jgi:tRNA (guanosine-2'-O-)-methyltransferase
LADEFIHIPMVGFTESLNISVTAALVLFNVTEKLKKSNINWLVKDVEKEELKIYYAAKSLKKTGEIIIQNFIKKNVNL